jgi:hypothetical protein
VAALKCTSATDCLPIDEDGSVLIEVQADGLEVSFKLEGLTSGTYVGVGWQDINNNLKREANEPFGVTKQFAVGNNQNLAGLIIRMESNASNSSQSTVASGSKLEEALHSLVAKHLRITP